jgi:hypothetical protein
MASMSPRTAEDVTKEWAAGHYEAVKAEREAQERAEAEWIRRQEARLHARRLAKNAAHAKAAALTASAGSGWRVVESPLEPHASLERLAKEVWARLFHAIPWPAGWRVRWGEIRPTARGDVVLGVALPNAQLILLDEAAQRDRTMDERVQTLVHEIIHLCHAQEAAAHGPGWSESFNRAKAFLFGPPAASSSASARPHPQPRKGVMVSGTPATWPGADAWEFRWNRRTP